METIGKCTRLAAVLVALAALALPPPAWAQGTGTGKLTVTDDGICSPAGDGYTETTTPTHFNVLPSHSVHLNIAPSFNICTAGLTNKINTKCTTAGSNVADCGEAGNCRSGTCRNPNAPVSSCSNDADCTVVGTCSSGVLECSGSTFVYVRGHTSTACSNPDNSECTGTNETECDTDIGFCKYIDPVSATVGSVAAGQIDVCYPVRDDMCLTGVVAYCGNSPGTFVSNATVPMGTQTNAAAGLRAVVSGSGTCSDGTTSCSTDADCSAFQNTKCSYAVVECTQEVADCTNTVGSFCCGLTQGAYGATNSVATAAGNGNCSNPVGMGYIPAAICQGDNPFTLTGNSGTTPPNATTIGLFGVSKRSVTLLDLQTLIAYLPAGGTAGALASSTGDKQYSGGVITPPTNNPSGSGSRGNGAGVLAGQTMACQLNDFLSDNGFTPSGFGGFTLPSAGTLLCTKRSGDDKTLGTDDDVCQAFSYASCVGGKTVQQVIDCANQLLAGDSNTCGCTATELNNALSNANVEFDQCGNVIDCGSQTTAGTFTCPS